MSSILKNNRALFFASPEKLIYFLVGVSALLSTWIMYIQHGRVKDDTILYFEVAKLFANGKWHEGLAIYNWSFYPLLIAAIHKLTTLPILASAQLLQVMFFSILTYSYLTLIKLAGGKNLPILLGALLIFSSPYIVGISLELLLRDQGFCAFLLLSIVYLLQFYRTSKIKYALLWQVCIITATLFRIEAVTYLVLLPLILLTTSTVSLKERLYLCAKAYCFSLLVALILLLYYISQPSVFIDKLATIFSIFNGGLSGIHQALTNRAQIISNQILGEYLSEYGLFSIYITLLCIVIIKCLKIAGLAPALLIAFRGREAFKLPDSNARNLFLWVAALAVLNALVIIFSSFVLEGRYILPFCLIVLLFATFALSELVNYSRSNQRSLGINFLLLLAIVSIGVHLLQNLAPKRADYNYEYDAVAWVKTHQNLNQTVFYNTERLKYYGGAPFDGHGYDEYQYLQHAITDRSIYNFDYIVIGLGQPYLSQLEKLSASLPQHELIHEVSGYKGKKKILIFAKRAPK